MTSRIGTASQPVRVGAPVPRQELKARFAMEAKKQPQAERHIHADRHVRYETVARVMSSAAKGGLVRIGS